jgi:large subunit ribosomal protein L31e
MKERIYVINLRKDFIKKPRWKRANRAIRFIREFIKKHMKAEKVKISKSINEKIWERSRQKPPGKIRVKARKLDNGTVEVQAVEFIDLTTKVEEGKDAEKTNRKD